MKGITCRLVSSTPNKMYPKEGLVQSRRSIKLDTTQLVLPLTMIGGTLLGSVVSKSEGFPSSTGVLILKLI